MPWTSPNSHASSHARAQHVVARCSCGRDSRSELLEIGNRPLGGKRRNRPANKHHRRQDLDSLTKREIRGHRGSRYCRAGSKARRHWMPILTAPQWQATSRRCPGSPVDTTLPTTARRPPLYPRHPPVCLFMLDLSVTAELSQGSSALVGIPRDDASRRRRRETSIHGGVTMIAAPQMPHGKTGT